MFGFSNQIFYFQLHIVTVLLFNFLSSHIGIVLDVALFVCESNSTFYMSLYQSIIGDYHRSSIYYIYTLSIITILRCFLYYEVQYNEVYIHLLYRQGHVRFHQDRKWAGNIRYLNQALFENSWAVKFLETAHSKTGGHYQPTYIAYDLQGELIFEEQPLKLQRLEDDYQVCDL